MPLLSGVSDMRPTGDLFMRRLEKSVQATCEHTKERIVGAKSNYPTDTSTFEWFCPDCSRYRYEELTQGEMDAIEREAK